MSDLQASGDLSRCMWAANRGQCTQATDAIIEAVGFTDMPTTMWLPTCHAHGPLFAYWATTQIVSLGQWRAVSIEDAQYLPEELTPGRLMAPWGANARTTGDLVGATISDLRGGFEIPFEDKGETYSRFVGPALPLPYGSDEGKAAEIATFDAAATWGMPDFIFKPHLHRRGSGIREVGDAVVLLHDLGLVVQVKRREAATDTFDREVRWLRKVVSKAIKQSSGSLRTLNTDAIQLENARGERLKVHPGDRRWFGVVVVDHPEPPSGQTLASDGRTLVLSRRDWEFLFRHLKSTYAVARYVEVAVELDPIPFDSEPMRYHHVAASGAEWEAREQPEDVSLRRHFTEGAPGLRSSIFPQLPVGESGSEPGQVLHSFFRSLQEDLAHANEDDDVGLRHEMLSRLDSLPPAAKEHFANTVLERLEAAAKVRKMTGTWGRLRISDSYPQLVYMVVTKDVESAIPVIAAFQTYEHYKFARVDDFPPSAATIGLLIAPQQKRNRGHRPWQAAITFVKGDPEVAPDQLEKFVEMFGPQWDDDAMTGVAPAPTGSG